MRKVIGYIRVSSAEQANEGMSLEFQQQKFEQMAALHEWDLVEVFVDAGKSARTTNSRDGLKSALQALKDGAGTTLLIYNLSRLARNLVDQETILQTAQKQGWSVVSITEFIDTTTPAGMLSVRVLGAINQYDSDQKSLNNRQVSATLKAAGKGCEREEIRLQG